MRTFMVGDVVGGAGGEDASKSDVDAPAGGYAHASMWSVHMSITNVTHGTY